MWSDKLRLIHEQEIYDPEYDVLDMNIPVHFAQYIKDILEDEVCFKDNRIMINEKETKSIYLMCWFQIIVLKEILEETLILQRSLEHLDSVQDHLVKHHHKNTRSMSEITFIRKNDEFSQRFYLNKTRIEEINKNLKLLNEFKKLVKERLNTVKKVDELIQSINLINDFNDFSNKELNLIEIISKGI